MACKCAQIGEHVREEMAENYGVTEPWSLVAVRAEGRERLYRCGECGSCFFMGRPRGAVPGESEVVYFRVPDTSATAFAALDVRPLLRGYYRVLLAREMDVEDEGTCAVAGCGQPGVRGKAYCPRHVIEARAGTLYTDDA
jgi:hypothetical protein